MVAINILILMALGMKTFALPFPDARFDNFAPDHSFLSLLNPDLAYLEPAKRDWLAIQTMLEKQSPALRPAVIAKTMTALACAQKNQVQFQPVLTIIDYSLPSSKKRFWVFDLAERKLLYHTHVSHGITSGALHSRFFSNVNNSKASSIGAYLTGDDYYGREGYSMRLTGLDRGFNNNAMRRYIVIHGGWYMTEDFIQQYGRPGRSWGCPTLPKRLNREILETIKDETFLLMYYPSDNWFLQSRFLNCEGSRLLSNSVRQEAVKQGAMIEGDDRAPILFADKNNNDKRDRVDPIIVVTANDYKSLFNTRAPLKRMLRRPIKDNEYIALSPLELEHLLTGEAVIVNRKLSKLSFIRPVVLKKRGRFVTQMKILNPGKIKAIQIVDDASNSRRYRIEFHDKPPMTFRTTNRFIRWLGL